MSDSTKEFAAIHLVAPRRDLIEYRERYEFRKDRPYHWLQKLAIWVLEKLKCYSQSYDTTVVAVRVHTPTFYSKFVTHYEQMLKDCLGQPKSVLIGKRQFDELQNEATPYCGMFQFGMTDDTKFHRGIYGNLDVYVLPWMDGVLILPHLLRNP